MALKTIDLVPIFRMYGDLINGHTVLLMAGIDGFSSVGEFALDRGTGGWHTVKSGCDNDGMAKNAASFNASIIRASRHAYDSRNPSTAPSD